MAKLQTLFGRRRGRVRGRVSRAANGRPRLSVHRTSRHIYVQIIDDDKGVTVLQASSLEADLRGKTGATKEAAGAVGKLVAERAKKAGIDKVIFDRGGFHYHGRVKALAEAAREGGLKF